MLGTWPSAWWENNFHVSMTHHDYNVLSCCLKLIQWNRRFLQWKMSRAEFELLILTRLPNAEKSNMTPHGGRSMRFKNPQSPVAPVCINNRQYSVKPGLESRSFLHVVPVSMKERRCKHVMRWFTHLYILPKDPIICSEDWPVNSSVLRHR